MAFRPQLVYLLIMAGFVVFAIGDSAVTVSFVRASDDSAETAVPSDAGVAKPDQVKWDGGELELGTVRFFDSQGKPTQLGQMAISPQGAYVAFAPRYRSSSSTMGVALVRLSDANLVCRTKHWSYYSLTFSNDDSQLLAIGSYHNYRFRTRDFAAVEVTKAMSATTFSASETLGFVATNSNGKLQVTSVSAGGPAAKSGKIKVGDEIIAFKEGAKRTLAFKKSVYGNRLVVLEDPDSTQYDNSARWRSLAGQSWRKLSEILDMPPGTYVQLRLLSSPSASPKEVTLCRAPLTAVSARLKPENGQVRIGQRGSTFYLSQLPEGKVVVGVTARNIEKPKSPTVSPDQRMLACVGKIKDHDLLALEVHDLQTSKLRVAVPLDMVLCKGLAFSSNSEKLYVASRDTVQVLDIASKKWLDSIALVPPEMTDPGQIVNRRIPLGLGGPGDLYTAVQSRVFSSPAPLHTFAVARNGLLAVGSESGDVTLYDLKSGDKVAELPMSHDKGVVEAICFNSDCDRLVAFSNGVLHVFAIPSSLLR